MQSSDKRERSVEMTCDAERRYTTTVCNRMFESRPEPLLERLSGRRALVVTTPTVERLFGAGLHDLLDRNGVAHINHVLCCTESTKTFDLVLHICRLAQAGKLDREGVLVSFGGGVCSDLVGFAASMIRRGIRHIRIPTTLIGQVDAGIAVKCAANFGAVKNYIGAFHSPDAVFVDPTFLRTLPPRQIRQGLSEIIKMAIIRDRRLFELIERDAEKLIESCFQEPAESGSYIVSRAIELMLEELQQNPYENRSFERLVDFGHTFSPQIEAASDFTLPHGEAVAIDMAVSSFLASYMGLMPKAEFERIHTLLLRIGLPVYSPLMTEDVCEKALDGAALHRGSAVNLVVPTSIGTATFIRRRSEIPNDGVAQAISLLAGDTVSSRRRANVRPPRRTHDRALAVAPLG